MIIRVIDSGSAASFVHARRETGVILSALNLFMLGFLRQYPEFPTRAVFWCDGLMGAVYMALKCSPTNRLRGVDMLTAALKANSGGSACILGSCGESAEKALARFGVEIAQHHSLDFFSLDNFDCGSLDLSSDFVLVTLPSPKQELLALRLAAIPKNMNKHFICIGGALNMLSRPELDCPRFLQILGLEFAFRLKTDTVRRINRLFGSFYSVIRNFVGLYKYKIVVINE